MSFYSPWSLHQKYNISCSGSHTFHFQMKVPMGWGIPMGLANPCSTLTDPPNIPWPTWWVWVYHGCGCGYDHRYPGVYPCRCLMIISVIYNIILSRCHLISVIGNSLQHELSVAKQNHSKREESKLDLFRRSNPAIYIPHLCPVSLLIWVVFESFSCQCIHSNLS